ncbi:MAG TPA: GNAT family N-acetyltransferase [Acidobacteriota bacterium]|nr:GNAT family N-acetyltransferase [Acidobacteriota bacterium]
MRKSVIKGIRMPVLPSGYRLSQLRVFHLIRVFRIGRQCFRDGSFAYKRFLKIYYRGRHTSFVVCFKGRAVGFIVGFMREDGGYVAYLAVEPENRKKYLGRTLMEWIHQVFADRGAQRVSLHVRTTQEATIAFYHKIGYTIEATREKFYPDEESAYVMRFKFTDHT